LWDGYFHALMYLLALIALVGLWRGVRGPDSGGISGPALLSGFALWHGVDAVLFHWMLGIHRIRMGTDMPIAWDLGWLILFGGGPLLVALMWRRRRPLSRSGSGSRGFMMLAAATSLAALWSLQLPPGQRFTTVVFAQSTSPAQLFQALSATQARLAWTSPDMSVVILDVPPGNRMALWRHGALLVSGSGLPNGCFAWSAAR
jgi:hypothetical protein